MKRFLLGLVFCFLVIGRAGASWPEVRNVIAVQRPHTALIDVTFDVVDADGDALDISFWYSINGGVDWDQKCVTVFGAVGPGIFSATGLTATWDAEVDFPDYIQDDFAIRVYADDGGGNPVAWSLLIPPESVSMPVTFTMGSDIQYSSETLHQVTLTTRFQMSAAEVTNAQYVEALQWAYENGYVTATSSSVRDNLDGFYGELLDLNGVGSQVSFSEGLFSTFYPDRPVVEVSWYGAAAYCDWLSLQEGLPRAYDHSIWNCNGGDPYAAEGYRLPTEAEWECACRAGTTTLFNTGDCLDAQSEGNYNGNFPWEGCPPGPYLISTVNVGSYAPNPWGLFDMHGNVWEWCNDWYWVYYGDFTDPTGPGSGEFRLLRGGSWSDVANFCRSAKRNHNSEHETIVNYGFRWVRSTN